VWRRGKKKREKVPTGGRGDGGGRGDAVDEKKETRGSINREKTNKWVRSHVNARVRYKKKGKRKNKQGNWRHPGRESQISIHGTLRIATAGRRPGHKRDVGTKEWSFCSPKKMLRGGG